MGRNLDAMAETSGRLLKLLSLLQTPREWPGPELARRLGVSQRTVRNDVGRLRDLGYPVQATRGSIGGYRLSAGTAMPPLLLDDDEAVAIAVALGSASGGAVEGMEETALRALTKLLQVLPKRLGGRVDALQAHTVRVARRRRDSDVSGALLAELAAASRDREVVRFAYSDHAGSASERRIEPYRLVNWGQRWYLVAFDLGRDDWRTFRVDRIAEPFATGVRFTPRELPTGNAAEYLRQSMYGRQETYDFEVAFAAPAAFVAARLPKWFGAPEPIDERNCLLRSSAGDSVEWLAVRLAMVDCEFTVRRPAELVECVRELGGRLTRAAGGSEGGRREGRGVRAG